MASGESRPCRCVSLYNLVSLLYTSYRLSQAWTSTPRRSDNSVPGNIDDAGSLVSGEQYLMLVGGPCGGSHVAADSADINAHQSAQRGAEQVSH